VLSAFFDDWRHADKFSTNESQSTLATHQLQYYCFIFSEAEGNDPKVSTFYIQHFNTILWLLYRNFVAAFTALLLNQFLLHTSMLLLVPIRLQDFTRENRCHIPMVPSPCLSLLYMVWASSISLLIFKKFKHALTLWWDGSIIIENIKEAKKTGHKIKLNSSVNPVTRKMSLQGLQFSKANWGMATAAYFTTIEHLPHKTIAEIIEQAWSVDRMSQHSSGSWAKGSNNRGTMHHDSENDEQAMLSGSSGEGEYDTAEKWGMHSTLLHLISSPLPGTLVKVPQHSV
jgi:hypothetical protein